MPLSIFDTKVFLQNQMRALTASKSKELKAGDTLSQEQKVTRRIKHYVNQIAKVLQPGPTVYNGDEPINQNITIMGAGAVQKKVKLSAENIDTIDSILNTGYKEAQNVLEGLTIETKEMSQLNKSIYTLTLGLTAGAIGSVLVGALAGKLFPASTSPTNTAGTAAPSAQPTNPAVAIGALLGGYILPIPVMYSVKKNLRTNTAALETLSIIASAFCYIKQAPQYTDKIIESASQLLYARAGGWADELKGWNNAILTEIGPFAASQQKVAKPAATEAKPSSNKDKQREQILAAKHIELMSAKFQSPKNGAQECKDASPKNRVEESKEVSEEMIKLAKYLRFKR